MSTRPTITQTVYITRGRNEREIEVEARFTFDADGFVELVEAIDRSEGRELTGEEWNCAYDRVASGAGETYAEWMAEYGEYLRDCQLDREAA
jgi:hypothetical protein